MGCDGGTIPRRDELVRTRRAPEQKDRDSVRAFRWRHCALTQSPFELPVVACRLGNIFSKTALLELLLSSKHSRRPTVVQHIRSMKDVRQLQLTAAAAGSGAVGGGGGAVKGAGYVDTQAADFVCPVVGVEMNGKYRFVVLWKCGCVISERALKMLRTDQCPRCSAELCREDVVVLNPDEEEVAHMRTKMESIRARSKAEKKAVKHKLVDDQSLPSSSCVDTAETKGSSLATSSGLSEPRAKKTKVCSAKSSAATSSKSSRSVSNNMSKDSLADPDFSKTKNSYSVATDAEKTEVYKSLFTTHESALKQPRAHWVTYNPLYY